MLRFPLLLLTPRFRMQLLRLLLSLRLLRMRLSGLLRLRLPFRRLRMRMRLLSRFLSSFGRLGMGRFWFLPPSLRLLLSLRLLRMRMRRLLWSLLHFGRLTLRLPLGFFWLRRTGLLLMTSGRLNLALPWLLLIPFSMLLNVGFLSILFFPLMPQLLPLLWWSRLIPLDTPGSVPFPMSTALPAPPALLKSFRGDPLVVPSVPVPTVLSVVPSPAGVYIEIKAWNIVIIRPSLVVIMGAIPTPFP